MCTPIALAAIAFTAVKEGASYVGQMKEAQKQEQYNKETEEAQTAYQFQLAAQRQQQMAENERISKANYAGQINQLALGSEQSRTAEEQQLQKNRLEAQAKQASALTAAGEAGVGGVSVGNLLSDYMGQQAQFSDVMAQNRSARLQQEQQQAQGFYTQLEGNLQNVQPYQVQPVIPAMPVTKPSLFASALKIAGSVGESYAKYGTK